MKSKSVDTRRPATGVLCSRAEYFTHPELDGFRVRLDAVNAERSLPCITFAFPMTGAEVLSVPQARAFAEMLTIAADKAEQEAAI